MIYICSCVTEPKHGTFWLNTQIYVDISMLKLMNYCLRTDFPFNGVYREVVNRKHFCKKNCWTLDCDSCSALKTITSYGINDDPLKAECGHCDADNSF